MEFQAITFYDWLLVPFYLFFIFIIAQFIRRRHIEENPEYKYFLSGLAVKILGAISLAMIYVFYYKGGDTLGYYHDGMCWNRLLVENPSALFKVFKTGTNIDNYFYFSSSTGLPIYYKATDTVNVVRLSFLATLLGAQSFLVASILFAVASFGGIWKMYRVFVMEFPHLYKQMAIAFLFIPSVVFWGSGLLKDTITLSCVGYFFSSFYVMFIKKKKLLSNLISLLISSMLILSIKPYIFIALLPGVLMWLVNNHISRIQGSFVRVTTTPVFILISSVFAYVFLILLSSQLGQYTLDNLLEKAVISQIDLKADYYKGNSFDIGELEPTVGSLLSHSHRAIEASLFRPYIWEANNLVMFLSGAEGLWFLFFTLRILFKTRIVGIFPYFVKHHLLTFSLTFSLFFAFAVGVSTSNFGSLVRYRIPILPFYIASLYIINYYLKEKKENQPVLSMPASFSTT